MPRCITKPILGVIVYDVENINFRRFINPNHCAAIFSNDDYMEQWCRDNKIEYAHFEPNYQIFKDKAKYQRDKDIVDAADFILIFADKPPLILNYIVQHKRKYMFHIIKE